MSNKEQIINGLTEESGTAFAKHLEALGGAIEKNDLERMKSLNRMMLDLMKDLPYSEKIAHFFASYPDLLD